MATQGVEILHAELMAISPQLLVLVNLISVPFFEFYGIINVSANACAPTEVANSDKADTGAIVGNTGDAVTVTCDNGYSGSGDSTCGTDGIFSTITCTGKSE